ncbi:hypothetical protein EHQ61_17070 [Leptospira wolffii]|uniref:LIC_11959 family protein n=1 Tax=Leptospira wolffii TaxID=409998 RepID=UPI0010845382|nr:hypothetical protein [Leptospira wolffii]TGL46460.1 hypothetical protein EHQ61_17070 [Leptospira wolffii]
MFVGRFQILALLAILILSWTGTVLGEPAGNTYRGTIPLKEARTLDIKEGLTQSKPDFPENLKLFYQGIQGNYAVFYDWNGHMVYYRYRENKFDRRLRKYVSRLAGGAPYEVSGEYLGLLIFENNTIQKFKKKGEETLEEKKGKQSVPVFQLKQYKELILEEILL